MEHFTPWSALAGGALIGAATSLLLLFNGRIAGISGIVGMLIAPTRGDIGWRLLFLGGLLTGGLGLTLLHPGAFEAAAARPPVAVAIAGLLVGFGTRLGSGCTSGHGVCGISRFSVRSMVATVTFIASGAAVVAGWGLLTHGAS